MCKYLLKSLFSVLLGMYPERELLGHVVVLCLIVLGKGHTMHKYFYTNSGYSDKPCRLFTEPWPPAQGLRVGHDHHALKHETGLQGMSAPGGERPGQAGLGAKWPQSRMAVRLGLLVASGAWTTAQCGLTCCSRKLLASRLYQNVVLLRMSLLKLLILVSVTVNGSFI